jgi:hypothetical protein
VHSNLLDAARPKHPTQQHGHGPRKPIAPTQQAYDLGKDEREKGPTKRVNLPALGGRLEAMLGGVVRTDGT